MRGASVSEFQGDPTLYYRSALDMIPKNLVPMFAYAPLLEAKSEVFAKDTLLKGLSGRGQDSDPSHIQAGIHSSLKEHPEILNIYIRGKA